MTRASTKTDAPGSVFWTVALAAFSVCSAIFGGYWVFFGISQERSIFHSAMVVTGIILLIVAGVYGIIEVIRRICHIHPLYFLPFGTLFVVIALLSGALLVANGFRAMRHTADTQILEELRLQPDAESK